MILSAMSTIIKWKDRHGYSFTKIGNIVGLTRTKVYRHAHGRTQVDSAEAALYSRKSKGEVTLAGLCKPVKDREKASA